MRILALLLAVLTITCAPAFAINQVLRDSHGVKIGEIKTEGSRDYIYDSHGVRLGYFDGRYTWDTMGVKIGEGNLLTTLLR